MFKFLNQSWEDGFKEIEDHSIDAIITDPPYGITGISWDSKIDFQKLWKEYDRILKCDGNIVVFSSGIFTIELINSNIKKFKYKLIWEKNVPTGMGSAKYRPMKYYEEICIFSNGVGTYNPVLKERVGVGKACYNYDHYCGNNNHLNLEKKPKKYDPDFVQPSDVLHFNVVPNRKGKIHPTQKPVELLEWLVNTYTNEGDTIVDNFAGSCSTGVACKNLRRNFIGFEKDSEYFAKAKISLKK